VITFVDSAIGSSSRPRRLANVRILFNRAASGTTKIERLDDDVSESKIDVSESKIVDGDLSLHRSSCVPAGQKFAS